MIGTGGLDLKSLGNKRWRSTVLRLRLVLFWLLSVSLTGCAGHYYESGSVPVSKFKHDNGINYDYRVLSNQSFTPSDWPETLKADVYLPDTPGGNLRPAVMLVHGGGWEGRSRADLTPMAKRFARAGYVAINVSYRYAPAYRFPAQLHDVQIARRWINDNAEAWHIDRERVAGIGYSSGAHLIALLALVAGTESDLDSPYGGRDTGFAAVVSGGTPADLRLWDSGPLLIQLMNGTKAQRPEAYAEASPVYHVHPGAPPFFLFHGTRDDLVPPEQPLALREALLRCGDSVELFWMRGRGHISAFLFRGDAESAALDFLAREMGPDTASSPDSRLNLPTASGRPGQGQ